MAKSVLFAEHCIFVDRKGTETMDSIARGLLRAIDALSMQMVQSPAPYPVLPIVVTNADLAVLQLSEVDLDIGALKDDATARPADWVAYTKTLSWCGRRPYATVDSDGFEQWSNERVRTVFVVRAHKLIDFLHGIDIRPRPWLDA
ncbi:MAG: hypothetical protein JNK78_19815 [Planctomycetes bacterium]|nr:hypothetical protein [Planctomycetota bacterium]